jgi:hypothetical protein
MNKWTLNEIALLKANFNVLPNQDLLKMFPNRTYESIYKKAWKLGMHKDKAINFINRSLCRKGDKGSNWKGGKKIHKGYIQILMPEHHRADKNGYVMEHIYVFEKETGIQVPSNCVVHHLDGNKQNNDISNLCLMSFGGHSTYHNRERNKNE